MEEEEEYVVTGFSATVMAFFMDISKGMPYLLVGGSYLMMQREFVVVGSILGLLLLMYCIILFKGWRGSR